MAFEKLRQNWAARELQAKLNAEQMEERVRTRGAALFRRHGVRQVILFGSVPARRWHTHSDIDLLALGLSNDRYWELRRELEEVLEAPVDLYTESDDPAFASKVIERGMVIYDAES